MRYRTAQYFHTTTLPGDLNPRANKGRVKMKRLLAFSILLFTTMFTNNAYAPDIHKFKVCVGVSAPEVDKTEEDIIESHLKRELRALGDVVIVDEKDNWQFRIRVSIVGVKYKDGRKAPEVSIARSVNRRVPRFYFNSYEFTLIPVYDYGPSAAIWHRDNLHAWCISEANSFDKVLKTWR